MMTEHAFPDVLRLYLKFLLPIVETALWLIQSYWIAKKMGCIHYVL